MPERTTQITITRSEAVLLAKLVKQRMTFHREKAVIDLFWKIDQALFDTDLSAEEYEQLEMMLK